jgi:hypothetical protein
LIKIILKKNIKTKNKKIKKIILRKKRKKHVGEWKKMKKHAGNGKINAKTKKYVKKITFLARF